jgi:drug/metabolite transporter (DMT)-like permease
VTVLLGLLAALSVGTSDFLGGLASRRAHPVVVTATSTFGGFLLAFVAALIVVGDVTPVDIGWGALGGVALALGLVALYAGYARTRVSIAAPVAGVGAAALPVIVESLFGDDTLSSAATAGVLLGLAAIGLVSIARSDQRGAVWSSVLYGLGGAVGIGLLFVCLANSGEDSGLWPIVAARGSGFVVLAAVMGAKRLAPSMSRGGWPLVIGIAALVTAGNTMFLTATRVGSTSVAAVLNSLFPAVTVFWAWIVFRERLRKVQLLGLGVALVAVALIAAG